MSNLTAQLMPELWVARSRFFRTNSGVFISQDEAVLIDPCMSPEDKEGIARFVAGQGTMPPVLVLAHSHWEHVLGPERFPGAKDVAQAGFSAVVTPHGAG